ncbi:hypothetical protein H9P43_006512 [Blastocladiella emersonii ATCC 22665]|nr:hypothetical protein H9P43_006512 [Blastocladiella emersonii ATCC 22665]
MYCKTVLALAVAVVLAVVALAPPATAQSDVFLESILPLIPEAEWALAPRKFESPEDLDDHDHHTPIDMTNFERYVRVDSAKSEESAASAAAVPQHEYSAADHLFEGFHSSMELVDFAEDAAGASASTGMSLEDGVEDAWEQEMLAMEHDA